MNFKTKHLIEKLQTFKKQPASYGFNDTTKTICKCYIFKNHGFQQSCNQQLYCLFGCLKTLKTFYFLQKSTTIFTQLSMVDLKIRVNLIFYDLFCILIIIEQSLK